jgi:hypothetical protein
LLTATKPPNRRVTPRARSIGLLLSTVDFFAALT